MTIIQEVEQIKKDLEKLVELTKLNPMDLVKTLKVNPLDLVDKNEEDTEHYVEEPSDEQKREMIENGEVGRLHGEDEPY